MTVDAPREPNKKTKPPLFINIELDFEAEVDGVKVGSLKMNRPTVQHRLDAEAHAGSDLTVENIMIGNLCDVDPMVIKKLYWSDYIKCQEAFQKLSGFRK